MRLIKVRLAPGVRVTVSTRGVRAHVGPRAARVHLGAGRTGISTGSGPLTYSASFGGPRRRTAPVTGARTGPGSPTPAQQEKAAIAAALAEQLAALETRHLEVSFPIMTRPIADIPPPDPGQTLPSHQQRARAGVPWYDLDGRRRAREEARKRARSDDSAADARWEQERRNRQEELDAFWRRLRHNDPATVLAFVQEAFEDNHDPAAIVGVDGDEAYVVVLAPGDDVVPDRMPGVTPTGRPSLRKMPAKDAAYLRRQAVAGALLVTLMETFAVAPGLASVKIAAVEGGPELSFVWSARVRRTRLERCLAVEAGSLETLECAADENDFRLVGSARRLGPLEARDIGWSELQRAMLQETEEKST